MLSRNAIVFVANDGVYDQTLAFLESIAQNSPGIPLVCIPYNDDMTRIETIRGHYGFSYHNDFNFSAFMEICTIMIGRPLARLRKIGAFTVPVDEFLSLDTDIIVLQDLRPLFGHLGSGSLAEILHFDLAPGGTYWVPDHPLIAHSKEINTGAFLSTRRIFNYDRHVRTIMSHYADFKRVAIMENDDQPFSSFVFDIERRRYCSVETVCDYSEHAWYKKDLVHDDGVIIHRSSRRVVPLIHYAGVARNEGYASAECFRDEALKYQRDGEKRVAGTR
jgi:hypothetical protein